ncbi:Uncharacterised protein [Candidatus Gugararchaeum adminiculabundum]|nr:Uncharacterised protein [Candidatus Gugararchaeum adminiculabundum]
MVCDINVGFNLDVGIALMLMLLLVSIAYMLSQAFKRQDWELWARMELVQVGVSFLIVIFIGGFAYSMCSASVFLAGGDPFEISEQYISNINWHYLFPAHYQLQVLSFQSSALSTLYTKFGTGNWNFQFPVFPGVGGISQVSTTLMVMLSPISLSMVSQLVLLQFIQTIALQAILPVGLILRIFPVTRDAGSFLIASAIAFYIIFPWTYVVNAKAFESIWGNDPIAKMTESVNAHFSMANFMPGFFTGFMNPERFMLLYATLARTIPQALFLPALSMVITVTFIKAFTKVMIRKLN